MALVPFTHRTEKLNPDNSLQRVGSVLKSHEDKKGRDQDNQDEENNPTKHFAPSAQEKNKSFNKIRKPYQILGIPEQNFFFKSIWTPRTEGTLKGNIQNILVAHDGRPNSVSALKTAQHFTQKFHCKMWVLQASSKKLKSYQQLVTAEQFKEQCFRDLGKKDFALAQHDPKLAVHYLTHHDPAIGNLNFAQKKRCSLILLNTFAKWTSQKSIFTQDAIGILKEASCPVMILPKTLHKIRHILIPISHHPSTYMTITQGIILSRIYNAPLKLLHVSQNENSAQQESYELNRLMSRMNWKDIPHEYISKTGSVVNELNQFVKTEEIDLVILSSGKNDSISNSVHPQITAEFIHQSPCASLVVHPPAGLS